MEIQIEMTPEALKKLIDNQRITVGIVSFGTVMRVVVARARKES